MVQWLALYLLFLMLLYMAIVQCCCKVASELALLSNPNYYWLYQSTKQKFKEVVFKNLKKLLVIHIFQFQSTF